MYFRCECGSGDSSLHSGKDSSLSGNDTIISELPILRVLRHLNLTVLVTRLPSMEFVAGDASLGFILKSFEDTITLCKS